VGVFVAKMIIMYEKPKDQERFDQHYFEVHVPLGRKIPNLIKDSVNRVVDVKFSNLNLYLITILEFENLEKLQEAFASPEARMAEEDGPNLFQYLHNPPIITIME
jgi:uncharacterized protein (TIGR02118 family)